MSRTPRVSGRKLLKRLQENGFRVATIKGSHVNLVDGVGHQVTVPLHDVVSPGCFLSICSQMGIEKDMLVEILDA